MTALFEVPAPPPRPRRRQPRRTEAEMLAMLRERYSFNGGNGPRYAFMAQVRSHAGFDAVRTLDALVLDLWPSKGCYLHGFEIKVSRADWLRELKEPEKAAEFTKRVDRFWLVVSDEVFVHDGELPEDWGLLAARGSRLQVVKPAPLISVRKDRVVDRGWLACILRAATKSAAGG